MTTTTTYSRPLPLDLQDIQAGDQVNTSITTTSYWLTVTGVIECAEDDSECGDEQCDGDCEAVLVLEPAEEFDPSTWHVRPDEVTDLRFRVPADTGL